MRFGQSVDRRTLARPAFAIVPIMAVILSGCADKVPDPKSGVAAEAGSTTRPDLDKSEITFAGSGSDRVFFDYDKAILRPDAMPVLQRAAEWLRSHPGARFVIEGHADERGTREYNLALGARRANVVKVTLASLGVPAAQIANTISYGKERPAVVGSNEEAWAQNRRAVMVADDDTPKS